MYGRALGIGLSPADLRRTTFNKVMNILSALTPATEEEPDVREATQADIDAFRRS